MVRTFGFSIALALGAVTVLACSSEARECNVGADCASGACSVTGMCVQSPLVDGGEPEAGHDGGVPDASFPDAPVSMDGSCTVTDGGSIARTQIVLQAGLHATFRVAENVNVSTAGEMMADGSRYWDYSGSLSGDHDVLVQTLSLDGTWYQASFPESTYATQLSDTSTLLGVFQISESVLTLQGVVSPEAGITDTKLSYNPAVRTLEFPLALGGSWTTTAEVSGTAAGVPGAYTENYKTTVDAQGMLKTPLATFSVLRVGTVLTRTTGVVVTVIRSFAFVTDCYGPVATITSKDDELSAEFTTAAEIRRIAP
jgi:hypothetical protein